MDRCTFEYFLLIPMNISEGNTHMSMNVHLFDVIILETFPLARIREKRQLNHFRAVD